MLKKNQKQKKKHLRVYIKSPWTWRKHALHFRVWSCGGAASRGAAATSDTKKTATMADISLYLTNVNVSIGQTMELQQVCEQLPLRRETRLLVFTECGGVMVESWWSHGGAGGCCCHLSAVFSLRLLSLSAAVITHPVCRATGRIYRNTEVLQHHLHPHLHPNPSIHPPIHPSIHPSIHQNMVQTAVWICAFLCILTGSIVIWEIIISVPANRWKLDSKVTNVVYFIKWSDFTMKWFINQL